MVGRAFGKVYEALLRCEGEQIGRFLLPAVRGERMFGRNHALMTRRQ